MSSSPPPAGGAPEADEAAALRAALHTYYETAKTLVYDERPAVAASRRPRGEGGADDDDASRPPILVCGGRASGGGGGGPAPPTTTSSKRRLSEDPVTAPSSGQPPYGCSSSSSEVMPPCPLEGAAADCPYQTPCNLAHKRRRQNAPEGFLAIADDPVFDEALSRNLLGAPIARLADLRSIDANTVILLASQRHRRVVGPLEAVGAAGVDLEPGAFGDRLPAHLRVRASRPSVWSLKLDKDEGLPRATCGAIPKDVAEALVRRMTPESKAERKQKRIDDAVDALRRGAVTLQAGIRVVSLVLGLLAAFGGVTVIVPEADDEDHAAAKGGGAPDDVDAAGAPAPSPPQIAAPTPMEQDDDNDDDDDNDENRGHPTTTTTTTATATHTTAAAASSDVGGDSGAHAEEDAVAAAATQPTASLAPTASIAAMHAGHKSSWPIRRALRKGDDAAVATLAELVGDAEERGRARDRPGCFVVAEPRRVFFGTPHADDRTAKGGDHRRGRRHPGEAPPAQPRPELTAHALRFLALLAKGEFGGSASSSSDGAVHIGSQLALASGESYDAATASQLRGVADHLDRAFAVDLGHDPCALAWYAPGVRMPLQRAALKAAKGAAPSRTASAARKKTAGAGAVVSAPPRSRKPPKAQQQQPGADPQSALLRPPSTTIAPPPPPMAGVPPPPMLHPGTTHHGFSPASTGVVPTPAPPHGNGGSGAAEGSGQYLAARGAGGDGPTGLPGTFSPKTPL